MKKVLIVFVTLVMNWGNGFTQNTNSSTLAERGNRPQTSRISIETDPTAFFFNGFSLAVRRSATLAPRLTLGIGWYKTTLPKFYVEASSDNVGKGWQVNNSGGDLFADYHFFDPNNGLSAGMALSVYQFTVRRQQKQASYHSFIQTLRVGYMWRPFNKWDALYLFPWVGISTGQRISGTDRIDGEVFETPTWSIVPAFQLGYSFY